MPIYLENLGNGTLGARARRNMSFRYGPYEVDTLAELKALQAEFPEYSRAAGKSAAARGRGASTERARVSTSTPARGSGTKEKKAAKKEYAFVPREPGSPVSYMQGKTIGCSIGGMSAYCTPLEGESHAAALTRMGLDFNKANAVIDELIRLDIARVYPGRKPNEPEALQSQAILTQLGGVACGVRKNPRHRF